MSERHWPQPRKRLTGYRFSVLRDDHSGAAIRVREHATADELLEAFVQFMLAAGYQQASIDEALLDAAATLETR